MIVPDRCRNLLASISIVGALLGCEHRRRPDVPAEIRGVWRTNHRQYEGRYFELRDKAFIVATGPGATETFTVAFVEAVEDEENVTHRIHYANDEGKEYVLSISFDAMDGRIVYSNQPDLAWYRD